MTLKKKKGGFAGFQRVISPLVAGSSPALGTTTKVLPFIVFRLENRRILLLQMRLLMKESDTCRACLRDT